MQLVARQNNNTQQPAVVETFIDLLSVYAIEFTRHISLCSSHLSDGPAKICWRVRSADFASCCEIARNVCSHAVLRCRAQIREKESLDSSDAAIGMDAAAVYLDWSKRFEGFDLSLANRLSRRIALPSKNKEEYLIAMAKVFKSVQRRDSPVVLFERGTHGQNTCGAEPTR